MSKADHVLAELGKYGIARAIGYIDGLRNTDNREEEVCEDGDCYRAYRLGHDDGFYVRLNRLHS